MDEAVASVKLARATPTTPTPACRVVLPVHSIGRSPDSSFIMRSLSKEDTAYKMVDCRVRENWLKVPAEINSVVDIYTIEVQQVTRRKGMRPKFSHGGRS